MNGQLIIPNSTNPLADVLGQVTMQMAQQITAQAGTQVDIFTIGYIPSSGQLEIAGTQPPENVIRTLKRAIELLEGKTKSGLIIPG